jgi:hypothetical protein
MDIFSKAQVIAQGSLEDFAEWAACNKVYILENGTEFIAIRNQQEEYNMVLDPRYMTARLVYSKGTYIGFDWDSLFNEKVAGSGTTQEDALANAKKQMRNDSTIIGNPVVVTQGRHGVTDVEGFTEQEVRSKWIQISKNPQFAVANTFSGNLAGAVPKSKVLNIECVTAPQNSMFGLSKKPGIWKFYWMIEWVVEITYR